MNLTTYNPTVELERFFDTSDFFTFSQERVSVAPRVNILEEKDSWTLGAEVPGWNQNDINVEVHDGMLTLRGNKEESKEDNKENSKGTYSVREFHRKNFSRSFRLGEQVDPEHVSAKLNDGILTITLQKKEEAKPKQIQIKID